MNEERDGHRDEFLRALGWVALQGGMLEEALVDLYWAAKGLEEQALIKEVRDLTLGGLKKRVMDALHQWSSEPELQARAQALSPKLDEAVRLRNEHIHAGWVFGANHVERNRHPRGGVVRGEHMEMTVQDVEQVGDVIGDTAEEVWELYDEVVERAPRLPPRYGIVLTDGTYLPCSGKSAP